MKLWKNCDLLEFKRLLKRSFHVSVLVLHQSIAHERVSYLIASYKRILLRFCSIHRSSRLSLIRLNHGNTQSHEVDGRFSYDGQQRMRD